MKTAVSIIIAAALIGGVILYAGSTSRGDESVPANNVTIVDGVQIVEINARGGYSPIRSVAKAGIPTVVRFKTAGTFDCSSAIVIPSMNISRQLASSGSLDIDLGNPQASVLQGSCGMGMYPFQIDFQN